jgi:gamma-glutamylcyclotransferase (GGCT)/AIG2-like uncharacterized protein YtfP
MFVYSVLREGYSHNKDFVEKGAIKMGTIAHVRGFYLQGGNYGQGPTTAIHLEMVPSRNRSLQVSGELYMVTPECMSWVDELFRMKMFDRAVVPVSWHIKGLPFMESAWTYIFSSLPHTTGKRFASVYELDSHNLNLTGGGIWL